MNKDITQFVSDSLDATLHDIKAHLFDCKIAGAKPDNEVLKDCIQAHADACFNKAVEANDND